MGVNVITDGVEEMGLTEADSSVDVDGVEGRGFFGNSQCKGVGKLVSFTYDEVVKGVVGEDVRRVKLVWLF